MDPVVRETVELLEERATGSYFGEAVTELEHALQAAEAARRAEAPRALVVATLLHDVGHLLHEQGEDVAERGVDAGHEAIGADWLAPRFGRAVADPVRLHVEAKRYLVAAEPGYAARLSEASVQSLALQGGPMDKSERRAFLASPGAEEALRLRRWDEAAKRLEPKAAWRLADYLDDLQACSLTST